jgi:hypothetical protein
LRSRAVLIVFLASAGAAGCHRTIPEPPPGTQAALEAELAQLQSGGLPSYLPPDGFVPDSATAARIAEAVWIPIYGEAHIRRERPYHASLEGDVWRVVGYLPPNHVGGTALAEISKSDGRILRVIHSK